MAALEIRPPAVEDGADMWRLARDVGKLDLNASYAYLLWCRDFASTSVIVRDPGDQTSLLGFITGYIRPNQLDVLLVWQVAVAQAGRGRGVASAMLDHLLGACGVTPGGVSSEATVAGAVGADRAGGSPEPRVGTSVVRFVETTVTPDNEPSMAMFRSLARRWDVGLTEDPLFASSAFPDPHEPEHLLRIGPFPD